MRFTINTYPARGHAVGSGGNGERRGSGGAVHVWVPDEEMEERGTIPLKTPRSKFIDQIVAEIESRKIQSANAGESRAENETSEERQQKRKRAA